MIERNPVLKENLFNGEQKKLEINCQKM